MTLQISGVWTIRIFAAQDGGSGEFHMWLPITRFLSSQTYFLKPNPYVTITDPGIAERPITTSTYKHIRHAAPGLQQKTALPFSDPKLYIHIGVPLLKPAVRHGRTKVMPRISLVARTYHNPPVADSGNLIQVSRKG